jgi:hypothetical protein
MFEDNKDTVRVEEMTSYFRAIKSNPDSQIVRHFIQKLRLSNHYTSEWYQTTYENLKSFQGDLIDELKVELELGFKYK